MKELKPCPFCGEKKKLDYYATEFYFIIHCFRCGANGSFGETEKRAKEEWNKREEKEK